jgi:hypothetical protein
MAAKKAYPLRLREDILEAVAKWADDDLRSVNGQIEFLLRDALWRAGRLKRSETGETTEGESET